MSFFSQRILRILELFLFSVLLLSVVRLEYFLWNHHQFTGQETPSILMAFGAGLRFDLAASAWLNAPLFLLSLLPWSLSREKIWRRLILVLFLFLQIPLLTLNLIDVELVNFVGRRMTWDVLFLLNEAQGKAGGFLSAFGLLFFIAGMTILFGIVGTFFIFRTRLPSMNGVGVPHGRIARGVFSFLCFLGFVIASRGGLQSKPLHFVNAQVFSSPALNNMVLNTSFVLLKNWNQESLPRRKFFESSDEMISHLNGGVRAPSLLEGLRLKSPAQNVIVLVLESFGLEYLDYAPFLRELSKKSLFFKNGFANGRRSIEGIPAVLSSVPALMNEPFITSPFSANRVPGLASLLTSSGYSSAFFHGGHNGTMHFDSYAQSAGFEKYFGAREYPRSEDDDGVWGIYDGPFMLWMNEKISAMRSPFIAGFFSLSSHQPYLIPNNLRDQFRDGPIPILKTIGYTDDALKKFFAAASLEPWFQNTLFVITADHTAMPFDPALDNELSRYRVPILFYHPGFSWPSGIDREQIVQQIDVLPSVMDFLGLPMKEKNLLARSVFVPGQRTAAAFVDGSYYEMGKELFVHWPREGEPRLYSLQDPSQRMALPFEGSVEGQDLLLRLKAAIQYFSESMWKNEFVRPVPATAEEKRK